MSPKKATIILLIITLALVAVFAVFYFIKKTEQEKQRNFLPTAEDKAKGDQKIIIEKIAEITAKGEQDGKTKDEIRENVISGVNEYMREIIKNQTPEEKAIMEAKGREREKIIQEFNNSLKK
jgi:flagellar basal body-associated protein FliL